MTQPTKEKSLVVEALTDARKSLDGFWGTRDLQQFDKAIRIAEIEHKAMELIDKMKLALRERLVGEQPEPSDGKE
jgi:hypothetical protein